MGIPTQIMHTKNVRKRNDEISLTGSVSDDDIEEGRLRNRIKGGGNVKRKSTKKLDVDLGEEKYDKKKSFRGKRIDDDELSVDLLPLLNGGDEESQKAVHDDDYKNSPAPPLTKILRLFRPEWPVCVLGIVLMLITEFTNLYNPAVIAACYELVAGTEQHGTPEERLQKVTSTFVVVLIVHLIGNVSTFFRCSLVGVVSERVVARLRARLYRNLLRQDIAFFDKHNTGDLSSHLTSDTGLLQEAISQALPEIVVGSIKLVGASIAMLWISPSLALVTVGCVGTSIAMSSVFGKWMGKWTRRYYDVYGRAQSHCYEALAAMRLVQSFTAESKEEERFNSFLGSSKGWFPSMRGVPSESMYELGKAKAFVTASFYTFLFFSGFGSIYISTWYGFRTVIDGHLSFGQFTAFQAFMIQVGVTVVNTSRFIGQFLDSQSASARIMYLLERVPQIPTPRRSLRRGISKKTQNRKPPKILLKPHSMQGAIEFKDVHFRYPTRPAVPVLVGVSLSVPANTTVAFVGPSGAGKSTLVSLLQRFYDVSEGSVCIDGIDIRDLDVKWLRSHVGYVQQEPQMFGISIRDNICYGVDRQVDQTELEAVCRKANAHDFIQKWPDGYDTMVGERGVSLSGGQKQRIAIARALLVNPRILLLDEATSALDSESEHLVQEAIDNAVTGRTVVVIAHRLSTIKNADQIVLVDSHKIVDVGTHEVMMQRCKQYRELIKRQSFAHSVDPTLLLDA